MVEHNKLLDEAAKQPGSTVGPARYVIFAQLFWSNQSDNYDDRFNHSDKAFLPNKRLARFCVAFANHYNPGLVAIAHAGPHRTRPR